VLVLFGGGHTLGDADGLGRAVVAVVAGEVRREGIEVANPGAEPVPEYPQRVGCPSEGVPAGGAVGVVVDGVQQPGHAGTGGPPLV
jgi:hypothetical protein